MDAQAFSAFSRRRHSSIFSMRWYIICTVIDNICYFQRFHYIPHQPFLNFPMNLACYVLWH